MLRGLAVSYDIAVRCGEKTVPCLAPTTFHKGAAYSMYTEHTVYNSNRGMCVSMFLCLCDK